MGPFLCRVIKQVKISRDIFLMSLEAEQIACSGQPGQFVHLRTSRSTDPLLRRPYSIHRVNRNEGTIQLMYRVVGKGSESMREAVQGDLIDLIGPLGTAFNLDRIFSKALIVAGGMGSAPLFFLIDRILELKKSVIFFWGAQYGQEMFGLKQLQKSGVDLHLTSEDGSLGHRGVVTDLLSSFLKETNISEGWEGFTCGPAGMLQSVQRLAIDSQFSWQVSYEERMACGVGVCMGCAVEVRQGGYKMVCSDGPVFDLKEIIING